MAEKVFTFGDERATVGVLTTPEADRGRPTFLLLNAGLIHRVGPYRMNVDLARRLSQRGFESLRYDQCGLGDSEPRHDQRSYEQRAVEDVREAMDALGERKKRERFVLVGLCSGAINAHRAAMADPRIAGCVFIDGWAYKTAQFQVRRVVGRALSPERLANFASRSFGRFVPALARSQPLETESTLAAVDEREAIFERYDPPQEEVARDLAVLTQRNVQLLFVYTSGVETSYNHADQLFEAFPQPELRRVAEVAHFPLADHTFTLLADREAFFARVLGWAEAKFARLGGS